MTAVDGASAGLDGGYLFAPWGQTTTWEDLSVAGQRNHQRRGGMRTPGIQPHQARPSARQFRRGNQSAAVSDIPPASLIKSADLVDLSPTPPRARNDPTRQQIPQQNPRLINRFEAAFRKSGQKMARREVKQQKTEVFQPRDSLKINMVRAKGLEPSQDCSH